MLCAIGCNSETYWDVDCRYSFHEFEERYYPIDATPEAIRQVASDQVPDRLDGWLLAATHLAGRILRCQLRAASHGGWQLVLLGPNSD
jgi:hypothetical protein